MILAQHALTTMHCNCMTEVRMAKDLDYGGIEFLGAKIHRFIDNGADLNQLNQLCKKNEITPVCINALDHSDRYEGTELEQLLNECEKLCNAAKILECPTLQVVFRERYKGKTWNEVCNLTTNNLIKLADIAKEYNVTLQIEPLAWAPMNSLKQCLEVIDKAGKSNVGVVIDFWHLWAGGQTTPKDVSDLDSNLITGVHFCDGVRKDNFTGDDEAELRSYLPGDGDVEVQEWTDAVKSTGYNGSWSAETYSPIHWEMDLYELSSECKNLMEIYILN